MTPGIPTVTPALALARCGEDHGYFDQMLITAIDGDIYARDSTGQSILTNT